MQLLSPSEIQPHCNSFECPVVLYATTSLTYAATMYGNESVWETCTVSTYKPPHCTMTPRAGCNDPTQGASYPTAWIGDWVWQCPYTYIRECTSTPCLYEMLELMYANCWSLTCVHFMALCTNYMSEAFFSTWTFKALTKLTCTESKILRVSPYLHDRNMTKWSR